MAAKFAALVKKKLRELKKSGRVVRSHHEGYAKILEEVDEVWDEVKKKGDHRDHMLTLHELVDVSARCQKMAEDLQLVPPIRVKHIWAHKKRVAKQRAREQKKARR